MAKIVKAKRYKLVQLTGFTDNVFTAAFNVTLNQNRAQKVSTRLQADLKALKFKGVTVVIVTGFQVVLVGTNTTAKGRAVNRRVVATLRAK